MGCYNREFVGVDVPFFFLVVASIEETAERYSIPKPFIGLILLPIVVRFSTSHTRLSRNHSTGQRCRARHIYMDGDEEQDGAYHYYLCGILDCAYIFSHSFSEWLTLS